MWFVVIIAVVAVVVFQFPSLFLFFFNELLVPSPFPAAPGIDRGAGTGTAMDAMDAMDAMKCEMFIYIEEGGASPAPCIHTYITYYVSS